MMLVSISVYLFAVLLRNFIVFCLLVMLFYILVSRREVFVISEIRNIYVVTFSLMCENVLLAGVTK